MAGLSLIAAGVLLLVIAISWLSYFASRPWAAQWRVLVVLVGELVILAPLWDVIPAKMYSASSFELLVPTAVVEIVELTSRFVSISLYFAIALSLAFILASSLSKSRSRRRFWAVISVPIMLAGFLSDGPIYRYQFDKLCRHVGYYMEGELISKQAPLGHSDLTQNPIEKGTAWSGALQVQKTKDAQTSLQRIRFFYFGPRWHHYLIEVPLSGIGGRELFASCSEG